MLRQTKVLLILLVLAALAVSTPGHSALSASSTPGWQFNPFSDHHTSTVLNKVESLSTNLSPDEDTPYVAGRLLVQFAPDTPDEEKAALHERLGAEVIDDIPALDIQILQVPEDAASMVFAYQAEPTVNYAEPDYIARIAGWPDGPILSASALTNVGGDLARRPNDPEFSRQWNLSKIRAAQAWDITVGSPTTIIAIVDTGVDAAHPDLQGKVLPGVDFVNGDNDPTDDQGHGTHVAGTAAAVTDNGLGIAGVAWEAKILPIKALSASGAGAHSWIANGIVWATDHGAHVINLSLGGPYTSATLHQAVEYAWDHGVVVVAAAGNGNTSNPTYPAAYENVIGVSATTQNDQRASFSNYGSYISVASPGVSILGTIRDDRYQAWSGTSMASPHVAGLVALLKSIHPDWTNAQIREAIENSTEDLGTPGWDAVFGEGRIDAFAALSSNPPPPTATPTSFPPTATPDQPTPDPSLEQELIDAINRERVALGLPPLQRSEQLMQAARRHSQDMANTGRCTHTGSDGSDPLERIRESGYPLVSGSEVIACGYQTPDDVLRGWENSPSHWIILTNANYVDIGCGVAQASSGTRYWTCNPARSSSPTSTPPVSEPTATPTSPTRTATPSPTPTRTPSPPPTDDVNPETTYITPQAQDVGWVVSNEPSSNHFGDDDIYAGIHGGQVYIGAIQFELSELPPEAKINWARLILTGQTREFVGDRGSWSVVLLESEIDTSWPNHGYLQIRDAPQKHLILPILSNGDLQRDRENVFNLDEPVLRTLERRLRDTQRVSFRIEGPSSGPNNLFSWDSGHGTGGLGKPPMLVVNYTTGGEATPTPELGPTEPRPTATPTPSTTPPPTATPDTGDIQTMELTPREDSVGWIASHQPNDNNFGDDDVYAGMYTGNVYMGGVQFDLSPLPANIEIVEAELLLTGQTRQYLSGEGTWQVELLTRAIDAGWPTHGYTDIDDAIPLGPLQDLAEGDFTLDPDQLDIGKVNRLGLTDAQRIELSSRRRSTGYVSFRIVGPQTGSSNVFSWDSGYGEGGRLEPPVLRVKYRPTGGLEPSPTPVPSATPTSPPGESDVAALIQAINRERATRGLAALNTNAALMEAAQAHSTDLAVNNRWSHEGSDGSTPQDRMRRAGYPLGAGEEVLAANSSDTEAILSAWLRNSRHEGILMNPDYVDIGAGHAYNANSDYGDYWTVLVARPADSGGPPDESQVQVTPRASAVGWVVSDEPNDNHFGDDDMYAGFYNGLIYVAAVQFDLGSVPPGAQITGATLKLTGQTGEYLSGSGTWTVHMLESGVDFDWSSHGYRAITRAASLGTVGDPLRGSDLEARRENVLAFGDSSLDQLADRLNSTGFASFRIDGPTSGSNDIFSWDSGYGSEALGYKPVLTIEYTAP